MLENAPAVDMDLSDDWVTMHIMLIPGKWKLFIGEHEYKTLVATALNLCIVEHNLIIAGYLITYEKNYLVIQVREGFGRTMLKFFFNIVKVALMQHFAILARKGVPFLPSISVIDNNENELLFEDYLFDDALLSQLLVNDKKELPYYNPQLEKMKAWLSGCDFCSYNKHVDQIGPVITGI